MIFSGGDVVADMEVIEQFFTKMSENLLAKMSEKLESELAELKDGQKVLTERMQNLENHIQTELDSLKTEVRQTRVLIESDVAKKIQIIAEQHGDIVKELKVTADYPETRGRVSTLEHVAKAHTQDIKELKKAVG